MSEQTAVIAVEVPAQGRGKSFWDIVWRAFVRPLAVRVAIFWLILLVCFAVFAPFLANSRPFTIRIGETRAITYDGAKEIVQVIPPHREFPLFAALDRIDLILLVNFAALIVGWIILRRTRRIQHPDERFAARIKAIGIAAAMAACFSVVIGLCWTTKNDARDFRKMARQDQNASAIFPPIPWGYSDMEPLEQDRTFEGPSKDHWLGTDGNGRDALARLLWGTRIVLGIGVIAEGIALIIGITVGALMGYFVGKTDLLGMRLVETFESLPVFFLILTFVAIYGRQIFVIMIILGVTGWTGIARFVRAEFLRLRKLDYVQAAIASGLPVSRILFRHILPNGLTPVIVNLTFGIAGTVMLESSLSFLGVGVEPPTPSWGALLIEAGNPAETFRWWLAIAPGLMIFLTVFAYNIIGESFRDAIDPRTNKIQ